MIEFMRILTNYTYDQITCKAVIISHNKHYAIIECRGKLVMSHSSKLEMSHLSKIEMSHDSAIPVNYTP